ncbi:hypothetical protein OIB37_32415 [Streptomyces sp. NBC_00820]|uniref:hypothetical protein n=1 Tax=Streptomyces sp. NBC_00820 TaxID=2975842 RepID=UPI002ED63E59|nr:hypothetical protein OIB37_32415 [Streptomyces sp. NBC_00820]
MHPSARVSSALAGLAFALGGVFLGAPAAHADIPACENQVVAGGGQITDAVRMACYVGLVGDSSRCAEELTQAGVAPGTAADACRRAGE